MIPDLLSSSRAPGLGGHSAPKAMTGLRFTWPSMVVVAALLAACSSSERSEEPVRAVKTQVISGSGIQDAQTYAGEVRSRVESRLAFRVPGQMLSREVGLGDTVKAGQTLARLDPGDLGLAQQAAQAAVRAAQTQAEQASSDLRRYADLLKQGFISPAEFERREATAKSAQAQLEQAQAQAAVQANQTRYALLVADAPGVITALEAEPGMVLAAGQAVVRLAHDGPRDVVFTVPEDRVRRFRELKGRTGALLVSLGVEPSSNAPLPATVREVALAADPQTRTFLVKADVGAHAPLLGQLVTVRMAASQDPAPKAATDLISLPMAAVQGVQGRSQVWLLDPSSMTVKPVEVNPAGLADGRVLIAAGLQPGQEVVVAGVHTLTVGQRVKRYADPRGSAR